MVVVTAGVARSGVDGSANVAGDNVWEKETERTGARKRETNRRERLKYRIDREEEEEDDKVNIVICRGNMGHVKFGSHFLPHDLKYKS